MCVTVTIAELWVKTSKERTREDLQKIAEVMKTLQYFKEMEKTYWYSIDPIPFYTELAKIAEYKLMK